MEMTDIPELENMWKEKTLEETEDQTKDPFIPAKTTTMNKEESLVYIEL